MKNNMSIGQSKKKLTTSHLVKIALLSTIAFILMQLEMATGIFPPFLKIELSDIPAMIGAFSFGPMSGVLIQLIKNLLKLTNSDSAFIGPVANFIVGVAYVLPMSLVYHKLKSKKRALYGYIAGTLSMVIIACITNYLVLIPLYAQLFGGMDVIIETAQIAIPQITDFGSLILLAIAPFNLLKAIIMSLTGHYLYKLLANRI